MYLDRPVDWTDMQEPSKEWKPPKKPHIWQEWERDMETRRSVPGASLWGDGWFVGVGLLIIFAISFLIELELPQTTIALLGRALQ